MVILKIKIIIKMFVYKQVIFNKYEQEIKPALQIIYGVGKYKSFLISAKMGLSSIYFLGYLNNYNSFLLSFLLDFFTWLEVRIKRFIFQNIKSLFDNKSYKGLRHKDSLPVRGQRTRTNASTKKRYKIILNEE